MYGSDAVNIDDPTEWTFVAAVSFPMPPEATITVCELEACVWGVCFVTALAISCDDANKNLFTWKPMSVNRFPILQLAQMLEH